MAASAGTPRLDGDVVGAYLQRLGIDGEPPPTAEGWRSCSDISAWPRRSANAGRLSTSPSAT